MDERRRFAVALAGVTGCLCLAAGIVVSGPDDATAPPVDRPQASRLEPLPTGPVPSSTDVPAPTPQRPATAARARALVRAAVVDQQPAHQWAPRSLPTRQLTQPLSVHSAPDAVGADLVVAEPRTRRGAVTGAIVTAGARVGGRVKTVGRTLRRVF